MHVCWGEEGRSGSFGQCSQYMSNGLTKAPKNMSSLPLKGSSKNHFFSVQVFALFFKSLSWGWGWMDGWSSLIPTRMFLSSGLSVKTPLERRPGKFELQNKPSTYHSTSLIFWIFPVFSQEVFWKKDLMIKTFAVVEGWDGVRPKRNSNRRP